MGVAEVGRESNERDLQVAVEWLKMARFRIRMTRAGAAVKWSRRLTRLMQEIEAEIANG